MTARQFLIVSAGHNAAPWVEKCIMSVAEQQYGHFRMVLVDDASTDGSADVIRHTLANLDDDRFTLIANDERKGAMFNQVHAIRQMAPAADDVILWLDSDDRLAHGNVLSRLRYYYGPGGADDSVLMTYGQYRSEPFSPTCNPAFAYPPEVIADNAYRAFTHRGGGIRFNHLRTVMAKLFYAMDDSDFQDSHGKWFQSCCDAAVMIPALELADGRFRFIEEVLYAYNSENPNSDWRRHPKQVDDDHHHILYRLKKKAPYGR